MFFELEEGTIFNTWTFSENKKVRVNNRRRQCALGSGLLTTGTVLLITLYYQIILINLKQGWRDSGQGRSPNLTQQDTMVSSCELP